MSPEHGDRRQPAAAMRHDGPRGSAIRMHDDPAVPADDPTTPGMLQPAEYLDAASRPQAKHIWLSFCRITAFQSSSTTDPGIGTTKRHGAEELKTVA